MVICIIALAVFSVLGIFSAYYRKLTKEAFQCVFRMVTFRPCETRLEDRVKSKLTTKLIKLPPLAKFVYKNFKIISWVFTILLFASLFYTARSLYNLATYGSCDPHSTSCIFNQGHLNCGSEHCVQEGCSCEELGCEAPTHTGCEGNCTCLPETCG